MGACLAKNKTTQKPMPGLSAEDFKSQKEPLSMMTRREFYDEEADVIISGFIHFETDINNSAEPILSYDPIIPRDIVFLISWHLLQSLKIKKYTICTLEPGIEYSLDTLHLEPWSILTTTGYNKDAKEGGVLCIKASTITIEEGASINMNGKGYIDASGDKLKGSTKKLAQKYKLTPGQGGFYENEIGGGCIYIECGSFYCKGGNVLAFASARCRGADGMIELNIENEVEFTGNSKILACNGANVGKIKIKCKSKYKETFSSKDVEYKNSYGYSKRLNIRPTPKFQCH